MNLPEGGPRSLLNGDLEKRGIWRAVMRFGKGRHHWQKTDPNRRGKISKEMGAQGSHGYPGKDRWEHLSCCWGRGRRGGEAVEGGKGQSNKGLAWHAGNFNFDLLGH